MSTQSPLSQAVVALSDTLSDPVYTPGAPASTVSSAWLIKLIAAASRVVALSDAAEPVAEPVTEAPKPPAFMTRDAILAVAHSALLSDVEVRAVIRFAPEEHRPDQTIVARPKRVCHDAEDELPILLDCYSWQYIFADRQEEGILTLEIV